MKRNVGIALGVVALLLVLGGTFVILEKYGPRRTIELDVRSTPGGCLVVGEVEVDGVLYKIEEKAPAKLTYQAHRVAFALMPQPAKDQNFSVQVLVDGAVEMSVSSVGSGARGEVYNPALLSGMRRSAFITTATEPTLR